MTIAATITAKQYTSNGVTTQYAFPNKIFSATDLVVTLIDLIGNQYPFTNFANATTGLSYTVQGVDVDTGCTVVFSGVQTVGWTVDIRSLIPDTQSTSIKNQGQFLPELHEEAFDRATRMIQDLLRLTYLFGIHGPDIETVPWPAFPNIATRKGMQIIFDPVTGLPTIGVPNTQVITTGLLAPFLGLSQTAAESGAGVTPTNLVYVPGNVLRYGADRTGVSSSTAAFNAAISQRKQGGAKVTVPSGLYKIAITVTGFDVFIEGESDFGNDVATVGLIADNNAAPIIQVGDGTTPTGDFHLSRVKMHGQGAAQYGLNVFGCVRAQFDHFSAIGFTTYSINVSASNAGGAGPTDYIFFDGLLCQPNNSAGAVGFQMSQPSNYPTNYCTAVYIHNGNLQAGASAQATISIGNNGTTLPTYLAISESYIGPRTPAGLIVQNTQSIFYLSNVAIDDGIGGQPLLFLNGFDGPIHQNFQGQFTVAGKFQTSAGTSPTLSFSNYPGYRPLLNSVSVAGALDFQDGSLTPSAQTVFATQPMSLSRSGSNFFIKSSGSILAQGTGLSLTNAAGNADAPLLFGISGIKILTGAGAPAAAVPDGSLYLRTDAGAGSPLYVRQNGAWANVALP